jgi:hypothetical protein
VRLRRLPGCGAGVAGNPTAVHDEHDGEQHDQPAEQRGTGRRVDGQDDGAQDSRPRGGRPGEARYRRSGEQPTGCGSTGQGERHGHRELQPLTACLANVGLAEHRQDAGLATPLGDQRGADAGDADRRENGRPGRRDPQQDARDAEHPIGSSRLQPERRRTCRQAGAHRLRVGGAQHEGGRRRNRLGDPQLLLGERRVVDEDRVAVTRRRKRGYGRGDPGDDIAAGAGKTHVDILTLGEAVASREGRGEDRRDPREGLPRCHQAHMHIRRRETPELEAQCVRRRREAPRLEVAIRLELGRPVGGKRYSDRPLRSRRDEGGDACGDRTSRARHVGVDGENRAQRADDSAVEGHGAHPTGVLEHPRLQHHSLARDDGEIEGGGPERKGQSGDRRRRRFGEGGRVDETIERAKGDREPVGRGGEDDRLVVAEFARVRQQRRDPVGGKRVRVVGGRPI